VRLCRPQLLPRGADLRCMVWGRRWVQRVAARVRHSAGKISHSCALSADFNVDQPPPPPLSNMIAAGTPSGRLKVCHLDALQNLFNSKLQHCVEHDLHPVYRDPLPSPEELAGRIGALSACDRHLLSQMLHNLVERLPHDARWPELRIDEFLAAEGEDNAEVLKALDSVCLRHLYHTIKALRALGQ
jgi:hypothetical protein